MKVDEKKVLTQKNANLDIFMSVTKIILCSVLIHSKVWINSTHHSIHL
jgi:hypothetical protein